MRGRRARPAVAALLLVVAAPTAGAQVVRGQVVDAGTGGALADFTAQLLDGRGVVVAATLGGDAGRYSLRAPGPGTFRVRVLRVGWRAALSPAFPLAAAETREQPLRVAAAPTALGAMRVTGQQRCEVRPDEGALAGALWAEVQKAALAVRLTSDAGRLRLVVREDRREFAADGRRLLADTSVERRGSGGPPYVSPPAERLARDGYVQTVEERGERRTWYFAPDAAVLTSEPFVEQHCLRVEPDRRPAPATWAAEAADPVALAFEPLRRGAPPDIRGVLWVDRASGELRELEYQYTALPRAVGARTFGGRVRFQRVPGGGWMIREWRVRAPVLRMTERVSAPTVASVLEMGAGAAAGRRVVDSVLVAVHEEGGEVRTAATADGVVLWAADAPAAPAPPPVPRATVVAGRVLDDAGRPVPEAVVALADGGTEVRTGVDGVFALPVPTGADAEVAVRRLGFAPAQGSVRLTPGDTARLVVRLRRVEVLDTVRTLGVAPAPAMLAGFEARRARGLGVFLGRDEIEQRRALSTADVLRATGAVGVLDSLGALLPVSQRGGRWDARRSRYDAVCAMRVAVDGVVMQPGFSLRDLPAPAELAGIEIYKGAASLPAEFGGARRDAYCGLVAVWTRSR